MEGVSLITGSFPSKHPKVKNKDGTVSHLKLGTFGFDDRTYVLPTMIEGKQVTFGEARDSALSHGLDKYPSFSTEAEAAAWIKKNHSTAKGAE